MNHVRTSAGGMMAIRFKTNTLISEKKQTNVVKLKPGRKSKKSHYLNQDNLLSWLLADQRIKYQT